MAFLAAAAYARAHRELSVGLHIDVGESICRDGEWTAVYQRVDCRKPRELEAEIRWQIAICRELLGRDPTHLDSHQHIHNEEPARSILDGIAAEMGVPLRHRSPAIRHDGQFYGQTNTGEPLPENISAARLIELLHFPEGVTERPAIRDIWTISSRCIARNVDGCRRCAIPTRRVFRDEGIELISLTDLTVTAGF